MAAALTVAAAHGSHPISLKYVGYYYACLSHSTQMLHVVLASVEDARTDDSNHSNGTMGFSVAFQLMAGKLQTCCPTGDRHL